MMRQAVITSMLCAPEGFAAAASCCIVMVSTVTQVARCPTVVDGTALGSLDFPIPCPASDGGAFLCASCAGQKEEPRQCGGASECVCRETNAD